MQTQIYNNKINNSQNQDCSFTDLFLTDPFPTFRSLSSHHTITINTSSSSSPPPSSSSS